MRETMAAAAEAGVKERGCCHTTAVSALGGGVPGAIVSPRREPPLPEQRRAVHAGAAVGEKAEEGREELRYLGLPPKQGSSVGWP